MSSSLTQPTPHVHDCLAVFSSCDSRPKVLLLRSHILTEKYFLSRWKSSCYNSSLRQSFTSLQGPRSSTLCDHLCELAITNNSRKVLTWAFEWMPPITQWWIKPVSRYQLWRFMCSPSILSLAVSCWSSQTGGCSSISIRLLCERIDLVPVMDGMREHRHHCVICWIKDTDRLPLHSSV